MFRWAGAAWVAANDVFYLLANELGAQALGVNYVSIFQRRTRSEERRKLQEAVLVQAWASSGGRVAKGSA